MLVQPFQGLDVVRVHLDARVHLVPLLKEELGWRGTVPTALDQQLHGVRQAPSLDVLVVVLDVLLLGHDSAIVDPLPELVIGSSIAGTQLAKAQASGPSLWPLWHQGLHAGVCWLRSLWLLLFNPGTKLAAKPFSASAVGHGLTTQDLNTARQVCTAVDQEQALLLGNHGSAFRPRQLHGIRFLLQDVGYCCLGSIDIGPHVR